MSTPGEYHEYTRGVQYTGGLIRLYDRQIDTLVFHTGTARESWRVRNKRCKSKCWSVSAKFLSFPAESKNEDGGQKSKTCQKFFSES